MKKKQLLIFCLLAIALCGVAFMGLGSTQETHAATNTAPEYTTYGNTNWVRAAPYGAGSSGSHAGSPSSFKIYMQSSSISGSGTIYPGKVLNWTYVQILIVPSRITAHRSFNMTRDSSTYLSYKTEEGGTYILYSGSLPDGTYNFTYTGEFRENQYVLNTYTYTYSFVIDRSAPTYSLTAGGANVSSGSYVNSLINYSANDTRMNRIAYQRPSASGYASYYGTNYSVSATETNNGWWYFYAEDKVYNTSSTVSVYLDTVKPVGKITANGSTVSSGSYTNKPFYYTATDTGGVKTYQYKTPGSSTWKSYSSGTTVSGANGWYAFRTTDKAGNISDESTVCYDTVLPAQQLYAGNTAVSSGKKTNAAYVSYSVSDSMSGIANTYVKLPGNTSYTAYTSGSPLTAEGVYYFYAVDKAGNQTTAQTITLDKTNPYGTLYAGTSSIANNKYTNAASVKFVPADNLSGVANTYVLKPSASSYIAYTSGTELTAEGVYKFYTTDLSGNTSITYTVTVDKTTPYGAVYQNGIGADSGSFVNALQISFTAYDGISGIEKLYVKKPNASAYEVYTHGSALTAEGAYQFYALDKANNRSATYTINLDRTKPTGTVFAGESAVVSGAHTNKDVSFAANDSFSGVAALYVLRPNESGFTLYTSGTKLTAEGKYSFYAVDAAGNRSDTYTVTIDKTAPIGQLYVDETKIENGAYTSGGHIYFTIEDAFTKSCFVKKPNDIEFTPYSSGSMLFESGKYIFYGIDESGNLTQNYTLIIDRTNKPLTFHNVYDSFTDGSVTLSWTDGNPDVFAPVIRVTVNGKPYVSGQVIRTIDTGKYVVESTDAAGNVWSGECVSTAVNVPTKTLQKQYYEATDKDGNAFAFESYVNAFAFALAREKAFVHTGLWSNAEWDAGIAMDAEDAENAANGKYFIYKKSGDGKTVVAYFTEARLNEVLGEYAKDGINSYYYHQKSPAEIYEGNNLYGYSDSKTILASGVTFHEGVTFTVDGEVVSSLFYDTEGVHNLTVSDEYGNVCEYTLIVVRTAPTIEYALGEGSKNTVTFDREYYLKNVVTLSVTDELDEMAMFYVCDDRGNLLAMLGREDTFTLNKSGKYVMQAVNHFGTTEEFILYISLDAPTVKSEKLADDKQFCITVTESADKYSNLQTLQIYKSTDNGATWILLSTDDYGKEISVDRLSYLFRTSGKYKVVITDEFRSGFDAVTAVFDYVQPAPAGVLEGVENGGYTNTDVRFTWTDEAVVTLKKNGETISYSSGNKLTDDGVYELTFENYDGYLKTYAFVIDKTVPVVELDGAENGQTVSSNVSATITEDGLSVKLFKDGELVGDYVSDTVLAENGAYKITATDRAGNVTEVTFTIDKTVNFTAEIYDNILTNKMTFAANEELEIFMTKDGETVNYAFGESLTLPGKYTVKLTDKLGNTVTYHFTITEPLVQTFFHNFDDVFGLTKVYLNGAETRLNYGDLTISESGIYEIKTLVDGKEYAFTVTVDSTPPTVTIKGVENGGTTKGTVTLISLSEEANITAYLNGAEFEYKLGDALTENGRYRFVITDKMGNVTEYEFEILYSMNNGAIALVIIGILLAAGITVAIVFIRKRGKFGKKTKTKTESKTGKKD